MKGQFVADALSVRSVAPSMAFYWCNSGCNTWHRRGSQNGGFHFAMVPHAEEEPTLATFPGTPDELARFLAGHRLLGAQTKAAVAALEAAIDEELR